MERIKLKRVEFMPMELDAGVLYVSEKYKVAAHFCPCGCGNKVVTPLGPAEWWFSEDDGQPTLYPSLGNWQLPCVIGKQQCTGFGNQECTTFGNKSAQKMATRMHNS